ncbi:MAG: hypothetical protein RL701_3260 [Pseudomonadota bacterium]
MSPPDDPFDALLRQAVHIPSVASLKPASLRVGELFAGKLRILRKLGEGGMGAVYEAEHQLTRHRRALKVLHAQMALDAGAVSRFLNEASAAGRIRNSHIVETFDAGQLETGEPYLIMELLDGVSLADELASRGPLPYRETVEILTQVCDGVAAAHAAGIIHRDLKPDNLFLVRSQDSVLVKLLDFGISRFERLPTGDRQHTVEGAILGTLPYMAPEQLRGEANIDGRVDVYALGVVLYECLTGVHPYPAASIAQLAVAHERRQYALIGTHRKGLPTDINEIVARSLAVDRTTRYESPSVLRAALLASLPPESGELGHGVRRRKLRLGWVLASLLVAVALIMLCAQQWQSDASVVKRAQIAEPVIVSPPTTQATPHEQHGSEAVDSPHPSHDAVRVRTSLPKPVVTEPPTTKPRSRAKEFGLRDENPF